jgi:hypothetical protein
MDSEELENLKKEYQHLPDSEIRDLLAVDPSEYEPGIFEIVTREADRRGLTLKSPLRPEIDKQDAEQLDYGQKIQSVDIIKPVDMADLTNEIKISNLVDAEYIKGLILQAHIEYLYSEYYCPAKAMTSISGQSKIAIGIKIYTRLTDADKVSKIIEEYRRDAADEKFPQDESEQQNDQDQVE